MGRAKQPHVVHTPVCTHAWGLAAWSAPRWCTKVGREPGASQCVDHLHSDSFDSPGQTPLCRPRSRALALPLVKIRLVRVQEDTAPDMSRRRRPCKAWVCTHAHGTHRGVKVSRSRHGRNHVFGARRACKHPRPAHGVRTRCANRRCGAPCPPRRRLRRSSLCRRPYRTRCEQRVRGPRRWLCAPSCHRRPGHRS